MGNAASELTVGSFLWVCQRDSQDAQQVDTNDTKNYAKT